MKTDKYEYYVLEWETWDEICYFIKSENFITGIYLDDITREPIPNGKKTSNTIGLKIYINGVDTLVKQGDVILKMCDEDEYRVMSKLQLERYNKLRKINSEL